MASSPLSHLSLSIYQVDAFASAPFSGNSAAIVPLPDHKWLSEEAMLHIAMENNLAETAFLYPDEEKEELYHLRWFTPTVEVDLCGHATLASAHVIYAHLDYSSPSVSFQTRSGILTVTRQEGGSPIYIMDFPLDTLVEHALTEQKAAILYKGLGVQGVGEGHEVAVIVRGKSDLVVEMHSVEHVTSLSPTFSDLAKVEGRGVIVTARAKDDPNTDIVSRFFAPQSGIDEDPVTGSAHTTLAAYWSAKLGKKSLRGYQASKRGGFVDMMVGEGERSGRVELRGGACTYMTGTIYLPL